MIQEVHKVTSARYSQEWSKWHCLHYPSLSALATNPAGKLPCWQTYFWNCWQTALLANCPACKLTSETAGKLPCWQTAPAGKLPCWQKHGPEIVVRSGRSQKQNSFAAGRISAGTRYSAPRCACATENRAGNPIEFQEILLPVWPNLFSLP